MLFLLLTLALIFFVASFFVADYRVLFIVLAVVLLFLMVFNR